MTTALSVICEDFQESTEALSALLGKAEEGDPKVRVASVQAITLLLAASFEEFVREMAKQYAIEIVNKAQKFEDVPTSLLETAWKRTLDHLSKEKIDRQKRINFSNTAKAARPKVEALLAFLEGDKSQDVFSHLIHNENNMRPKQLNELFSVSGFKNACRKLCDASEVRAHFSEEDPAAAAGHLNSYLEDFFERRNQVAHSLSLSKSDSPKQVRKDIFLLFALAVDLRETLELSITDMAAA